MYTLVFILVTFLVLGVLGLVFYLIMRMDKKIDKSDRLGNRENKKSG